MKAQERPKPRKERPPRETIPYSKLELVFYSSLPLLAWNVVALGMDLPWWLQPLEFVIMITKGGYAFSRSVASYTGFTLDQLSWYGNWLVIKFGAPFIKTMDGVLYIVVSILGVPYEFLMELSRLLNIDVSAQREYVTPKSVFFAFCIFGFGVGFLFLYRRIRQALLRRLTRERAGTRTKRTVSDSSDSDSGEEEEPSAALQRK